MKKLVTVTNSQMIADLRDNLDITLLYPLKSFCVGYNEEFPISEIDDYVFINRILDDNDLDELQNILSNSHIKGIVFDDLGIIDVVKDLDIVKILLLDHLATNTLSINYYLEYVDSIVVSNDLTENEIRSIVANAKKPLVVNVFGLKTLMYSRRLLLSNYENYYHLPSNTNVSAKIDDKGFKIIENNYGTKFYASNYYDALKLLDLKNVLFFWYDPILLTSSQVKAVILNNNLTAIDTSTIFLDQATFYKVGDE